MRSIAIITARSGSKRIPKKNIKDFFGKPIIAYGIEAALQSCLFDEVMVSTESEEIANVAKQYGASVPFFRSLETSNDFATTTDVIKEVIEEYKKRGESFESFMCIYPTAPFITAEKIKNAFSIFRKNQADCVLPIIKYSFPPQRALVIKNGYLEYLYEDLYGCRSQDLEPVYHDCGQYYLCKTKAFIKYNTIVLPKTIPIILDEMEAQDIDTLDDWKVAELKYDMLKAKEGYVSFRIKNKK